MDGEKKTATAPILKPTDDQKPDTFLGGLKWNIIRLTLKHTRLLYNRLNSHNFVYNRFNK